MRRDEKLKRHGFLRTVLSVHLSIVYTIIASFLSKINLGKISESMPNKYIIIREGGISAYNDYFSNYAMKI